MAGINPENGIELFATLQRELIATNDPQDAKDAELIGVMLKHRQQDLVYHPKNGLVEANQAAAGPLGVPVTITAERTLELVTAEYKADQANPQLLSEFNQSLWASKRQAMGLSQADLVVPQAPYTEDQIREFMGTDFALYVPQVVSTAPDGLILLGKGWPEMGSLAFQEGTTVKNEDKAGNLIDLYGWMRTEKAINAPHTRTNEDQARKAIGKNRVGDTLNIYAIAGQQSKLLVDEYLDQVSTWVRVLSSRYQGRVLYADFFPDGLCSVYWSLESDDVYDDLGARSVEVAKT